MSRAITVGGYRAPIADDGTTPGKRMQRARQIVGLLALDVAARVGVRPETVCRWERDKMFPRRAEMEMLAALYGVDVSELKDGPLTSLNHLLASA